MEETSELMKCLGYRKNRRIPPFLSQKKVHITLPAQLLNFFFNGEFTLQLCGLPSLLWLILVTAFLITSNDAVQAIVTFSLILVQKMVTNLHTVFLLFLCEHTWDLPDANFVIFQHYHHFQCTGADIQLSTESPCGNPPICADMLTDILWCDRYVWPSRTWLVFHVTVATGETHHLPLMLLTSTV